MSDSKPNDATITLTTSKATLAGVTVAVVVTLLNQGAGHLFGGNTAQRQTATATAGIQEQVKTQGENIAKIQADVGGIRQSVDKVNGSLENFKGYVEAELANLRRQLNDRVDEKNERLRLEILEMMDDLEAKFRE